MYNVYQCKTMYIGRYAKNEYSNRVHADIKALQIACNNYKYFYMRNTFLWIFVVWITFLCINILLKSTWSVPVVSGKSFMNTNKKFRLCFILQLWQNLFDERRLNNFTSTFWTKCKNLTLIEWSESVQQVWLNSEGTSSFHFL